MYYPINYTDILLLSSRTAELLGFHGFIPSFVTATGKDVLQGVNYASGAAGIRHETGQHLVYIYD